MSQAVSRPQISYYSDETVIMFYLNNFNEQ